MKISIRQGLFETNSSSVHALSIKKNIDKIPIRSMFLQLPPFILNDIINNGLIFGFNNYKEEKPEVRKFRIKCNTLWETAYNADEFTKYDMLLLLTNIKDLCTLCNINYRINIDMDNYNSGYMTMPLLSNIQTLEQLALYLFYEDSKYDIMDNNCFNESDYDKMKYEVYFD